MEAKPAKPLNAKEQKKLAAKLRREAKLGTRGVDPEEAKKEAMKVLKV